MNNEKAIQCISADQIRDKSETFKLKQQYYTLPDQSRELLNE